MSNTTIILKLLDKICEALNAFLKQDDETGLLSGSCGCALFYAYYYKLTGKEEHLNSFYYIVEKTVNSLAEKEIMNSHCSGMAGIAWGIQHLINNQFIDLDETTNAFEEVDVLLSQVMKCQLEEHQYDFLHEGLGIALYFLEKPTAANAQAHLEVAVALLEKAAVTTSEGKSWKDNFTQKKTADDEPAVFNLGLAHGMPAILSVLGMIHEKGIAVKKTASLIESGVRWLVANKNEPATGCISLYPCMVTESHTAVGEKQSRLAWCYGDLSIALTLWNLGMRMKNNYYKQEAYAVLDHTLIHQNKENSHVADASLCHGSMGISHIYRRLYRATGESRFLEGAGTWLQYTLDMATSKNELEGLSYLTPDGYEKNNSLLEGITGIGLALIAALDKETAPDWDRCLLIS